MVRMNVEGRRLKPPLGKPLSLMRRGCRQGDVLYVASATDSRAVTVVTISGGAGVTGIRFYLQVVELVVTKEFTVKLKATHPM